MGIHLFKRNGNSGNGNLRAGRNGNGSGPSAYEPPRDGGKLIVLTAPLTETIDHAGYFIQMGMASLPVWMEGVLNNKYPNWRDVERNADGSARYMPAGVRLVENIAAARIQRAETSSPAIPTTWTSSSAQAPAWWRSPRTTRWA